MRPIATGAIVGLLLSTALVTLIAGWKVAVAAVSINTAAVLIGLAARAWARANRMHAAIVRVEVDAYRALDGPDPFNERHKPTDTGDTQ